MNSAEERMAAEIAEYVRFYLNEEIEAIAQMVENEKFATDWRTDYTIGVLKDLARAIRARKRPPV